MKYKIRINSFDFSGSVADGPGIRSLVYLQGCERHCPGCHNPQTWDPNGGSIYSLDELTSIIYANCLNHKLTISGGEPLLQRDILGQLLSQLHKNNYNIALYTGYDLADVPPEILDEINYIKVGYFDENKKITTIPYIGSWNQEFIRLS